jgi:hypothetical protein
VTQLELLVDNANAPHRDLNCSSPVNSLVTRLAELHKLLSSRRKILEVVTYFEVERNIESL